MSQVNVKFILSYDGTDYNGFQSQSNGNTIEDYLKKAISKITNVQTTIYCAGRTDSGVHAEGQVINFYTDKINMNTDNWLNAVNSLLPKDIRILKCELVDNNFHSRRSTLFREYHYNIINSPVISALQNRYAAHCSYPLDIELLKKYAECLVGEHDFTSFCALSDTNKSKVRLMHSINIDKNGEMLTIKFIANAFLHKMIRNIVGTFLMLHKFEKSADEIKRIIESKDRKMAGPTYMARGLVFKKVYYK